MKLWKKILLLTLAALVLIVGGVGVWQRDNITAAYHALTKDSETIAGDLESVRQDFQQTIQAQTSDKLTIKPPSLEDSEALLNGTKTPEEIKEALGITQVLPQKEPTKGPEQEPVKEPTQEPEMPPGQQPAEPPEQELPPVETPPEVVLPAETPEELVNLCVAEMTDCQVDLMAELARMKQAAIDEWNALPRKEQTEKRKKEIGFAGLERCYVLEDEIDLKVQEILDRYETYLKAVNGDISVLDTLWKYYLDEKSAQKTYYMDKYMD